MSFVHLPTPFVSQTMFVHAVIAMFICDGITYLIVLLVESLHCRENGDEYWFIYLTNWSFFCLNVSLLVHAVITIVEYIKVKSQSSFKNITITTFIEVKSQS